MHFVFYCKDKPGVEQIRIANRSAHLDYLEQHRSHLLCAGPLLEDASLGSRMLGSLLILDLADQASADAFAAGDPYATAGLFRASPSIPGARFCRSSPAAPSGSRDAGGLPAPKAGRGRPASRHHQHEQRTEQQVAYWLVKSEPESWSWQQQVTAGTTHWDGVRNAQAASNLKAMRKGDRAFFYHSGAAREIVGVVEVVREYYPDPGDEAGRFGMVDVKAMGRWADTGEPGGGQGRAALAASGAGAPVPAVGRPDRRRGLGHPLRHGRHRSLRVPGVPGPFTPNRLCRLDDIADFGSAGFTIATADGPTEVMVIRQGSRAFAYVNLCPHWDAPLDMKPGQFLDRDRQHILCANHGAVFRIQDGFCLAGPCRAPLSAWCPAQSRAVTSSLPAAAALEGVAAARLGEAVRLCQSGRCPRSPACSCWSSSPSPRWRRWAIARRPPAPDSRVIRRRSPIPRRLSSRLARAVPMPARRRR